MKKGSLSVLAENAKMEKVSNEQMSKVSISPKKKLGVWIPLELHTKLKLKAVQEGISLKEMVVNILQQAV